MDADDARAHQIGPTAINQLFKTLPILDAPLDFINPSWPWTVIASLAFLLIVQRLDSLRVACQV